MENFNFFYQKAIMVKKRGLVPEKSNKEKVLERYDAKKGKKDTIGGVKRVDW